MQGIYMYIPETNRVPKEYCVAAILVWFIIVIIIIGVLLLHTMYRKVHNRIMHIMIHILIQQGSGENYMMRSLMKGTPYQTLIGGSN
jgi:hypothetical protein